MNVQRLYRLSIMLTVIVLYSGKGFADAWQQTVSARISEEYDTNPPMTPANTEGAWRTLFEPGYILTGILDENEVKIGAALQAVRSSNEALSPERNSPTALLDWLHHLDEGEFGISSKYTEIATRDAGIDATGLVPVASIRTSRILSGRLNKRLNELSTLAADASYDNVSYQGGAYVDYASRSANMLLNHAWSERSTPFVKTSYADFIPADGSPVSRFASAILGLNWKFSDALEGTLQAGKYKISGDTKLSTLGGVALEYTGELAQWTVNASRQVLPSGLGGFVIVDQANGSWNYALSERRKTGIDLVLRKTFFTPEIINRSAGAWLQQELNSFWGVRTYYLRNTLNGGVVDGAASSMLGITFIYTNTDF